MGKSKIITSNQAFDQLGVAAGMESAEMGGRHRGRQDVIGSAAAEDDFFGKGSRRNGTDRCRDRCKKTA